jgi:hypothetical protein
MLTLALQTQQQQIDFAATKEDALAFALGAAEQFLRAYEFATGAEKKQLHRQAKAALDRAATIKNCDVWNPTPLIEFEDEDSTADDKGRKTAEDRPSLPLLPSDRASVSPSISSKSESPHAEREAGCSVPRRSNLLIDLSTEEPYSAMAGRSPLGPKPRKAVAQLKPPLSTRRRTTKESIILLRASMTQGSKYPPWENDPTSAEFEQQPTAEKFRYDGINTCPSSTELIFCPRDARDPSLSIAQREMFKCWARPDEAFPPPLLVPDGGNDAELMMHAKHPVDLVQDAVTDCSVVASLCAATSRTEDGYGQVSL